HHAGELLAEAAEGEAEGGPGGEVAAVEAEAPGERVVEGAAAREVGGGERGGGERAGGPGERAPPPAPVDQQQERDADDRRLVLVERRRAEERAGGEVEREPLRPARVGER